MLKCARIGLFVCGGLLIGMALLVLALAILAITAGRPLTADASLDIALSLGATLALGAGLLFIRVGIISGLNNRPAHKPKDVTLPLPVVITIGATLIIGYLIIDYYAGEAVMGNLTFGQIFLGAAAIVLASIKWGRSFFSAS